MVKGGDSITTIMNLNTGTGCWMDPRYFVIKCELFVCLKKTKNKLKGAEDGPIFKKECSRLRSFRLNKIHFKRSYLFSFG